MFDVMHVRRMATKKIVFFYFSIGKLMMICILERENMCTNANKSLHQVRLSLTVGAKKHFCLPLATVPS
jgi:hypothetical protein